MRLGSRVRPPLRLVALAALAGLAALPLCVLLGCSSPSPDVILVTVDTLRADRLGAYGWAQARTPTIDRLAASGTLYTRAFTPLPRTTPGLASLLTGLEPHRHGSREVGRTMRDDVPTLAEILTAGGWATRAVSASGAADPAQGLDRGFEVFVPAADLPALRAEDVTRRALAEVDGVRGSKPLLLWTHYIDPHAPYEPPPPWGDDPRGDGCRELVRFIEENNWQGGHVFSDRDGRSSRARDSCSFLYDAEIAYTDAQIGALLEGLDRLRPDRPRLVIFTADHGENLGEEGLYFQHGPSLHDASLRVPLILAGSGIPAGRSHEAQLAMLQDVVPTLLAKLGLEAPEAASFDGIDLGLGLHRLLFPAVYREVFAESGSALMVHNYLYLHSGRAGGLHCLNVRRWSLCSRPMTGLYDHEADPGLTTDLSATEPDVLRSLTEVRKIWPPEEARSRMVRNRRFKEVEIPIPQGGYRRMLYNVEDVETRDGDPETGDPETRDVSARFGEQWRALGKKLDAWTSGLPSSAPPERSEEEVQRLRALGYAGGDG